MRIEEKTLRQHRIIADEDRRRTVAEQKSHSTSAYSALIGAPDQAARREGLSARIRFARANSIFSFAVCFRRPR